MKPVHFMLCGYNSEWLALKEASRMRRNGFQCQYLGMDQYGYHQVKAW